MTGGGWRRRMARPGLEPEARLCRAVVPGSRPATRRRMARPGLEPGTPRFSAACPPQPNLADLQRNREHVLRRRVSEYSRTFVAIAVLSGRRSRTCAQMT